MVRINNVDMRATDFIIESFDGLFTIDVENQYPHLTEIACHFPPINDRAEVFFLISRDLPEPQHMQSRIIGQKGTPLAQKLALGWTLVGKICFGKVHRPDFKTYKISILESAKLQC